MMTVHCFALDTETFFGYRQPLSFQVHKYLRGELVFGWSAAEVGSQCLFANRLPLCSYADPLCVSLRGRWIVPLACELQFESNHLKPEP